MSAPIRFDRIQSFVAKATRHMVGCSRTLATDLNFELLPSLIIVIVIIVLLLSQEDLGVGMAL